MLATIYYEDMEVGTIVTDKFMDVFDALELIDYDTILCEMGIEYDEIDPLLFTIQYE